MLACVTGPTRSGCGPGRLRALLREVASFGKASPGAPGGAGTGPGAGGAGEGDGEGTGGPGAAVVAAGPVPAVLVASYGA